ncbi:hypothetical protein ElyMa_003386700 [Elysia marginata]|uniref:Chitin-binding type-2 domain-containing protein n=1 Tax=Elysia marginata TaxID=1093978 RepID=A0AAV4JRW7_9GAST|nr:hypothetical protein ElyMa_003386700 [Elysia marginata]
MKALVCATLLGLILASSAQFNWNGKRCIDITETLPCADKPKGEYHICNFCQYGYFARCRDSEVSVIPCQHIEDGKGGYIRLIFDDVIKTCVQETATCLTSRETELNWNG